MTRSSFIQRSQFPSSFSISDTFAHFLSVTTAHVKLCVQTDDTLWNGGTDANVQVKLIGPTDCRTPWITLDNPGNDFEYNEYDCFEFSTESVGHEVYNYLQCVIITFNV